MSASSDRTATTSTGTGSTRTIAIRAGALAALTVLLAGCAQAAPAAEVVLGDDARPSASASAAAPTASSEPIVLEPAPSEADHAGSTVAPPAPVTSGGDGGAASDAGEEVAAEPPAAEEPIAEETERTEPPVVVHQVGAGPFTTQNGSASFVIPEGWSGIDRSYVDARSWDDDTWINIVELERDGVTVRYLDTMSVGPFDAADPDDYGVVESHELRTGLLAQSFWTRERDGRFAANVALVSMQLQDSHGFEAGWIQACTFPGEGYSTFDADLSGAPGYRATFATQAEAEAFLATPAVGAALDVIASVSYTGVDGRTLP